MQSSPVTAWKQLSALYEQAEELDGEALSAWLASPPIAGHAQFPALQRMLQARQRLQHGGFLDAPPRLAAHERHESSARPGATIGPYRLLRPLGEGGMAEVWLAERSDGAFARRVAIKLMFRHVGGAARGAVTERFARERDILASLAHPHIAALHDAGLTADGQPWLALEYVQGRPITAWCDAHELDLVARVRLFRQVLLAVQHAHANLVLHRDLKPANVLVTDAGEVRLLDFGIAKLLDPAAAAQADTELTRAGGRPMTPLYASPEQLRGEPLTIACDVYALGVLLYELLSGERPYEVPVDSIAQLEQAILDADPRAPSRRTLREAAAQRRSRTPKALRRELAGDLDAIVLQALAKAPARRYPSADAMRVDLDRWLAGEPVAAHAPSAVYRLGKFVRRHAMGVGLGSGAALALAAAATIAVVQGRQAQHESARAVAARDFLIDMLKNADVAKSRGADVTAREILDNGRLEVARRLADQPQLQAELLQAIASTQHEMGEYAPADATYGQLTRLLEARGDRLGLARARSEHAVTVFRLDDLPRTLALVAQARESAAQAGRSTELDGRLDWLEGWVYSRRGELDRARALFERSLVRAEQAHGPRHLRTIEALQGLSMVAAQRRDYGAALSMQDDIAGRAAATPDLRPRDRMTMALTHVYMLSQAGQHRAAFVRAHASAAGCGAELGPGDLSCQRLALQATLQALRIGRPEGARDLIPILRAGAADGGSPALQVRATMWLCRLQAALDGRVLDAALAGRLAQVGEAPPPGIDADLRLSALLALADAALRVRQPQQAQQWAERVLADPQLEGADTGTRAWARHLLGVAQLHRGRPAEAAQTLAESGRLYESVLGADRMALVYSINRALALEALGRRDEARSIVARAQPALRDALGDDSPTYLAVVEIQRRLERAAHSGAGAGAPPSADFLALFV